MKFKLIEEEANPVLLEEDDLLDGVMECEASLLVKILSIKDGFVSLQGFSLAMSKAWDCKNIRVSRSRGVIPLTLPFDESKFWIQVRGLKVEYFTKEVAGRIVHAFKGWEAVELRKDKMENKFFQVRALIKVSLPIRRMISFRVGNELGAGYLAYERLSFCCFHCGLLGHLIKQCPSIPAEVDPWRSVVYGLWMKAPVEKSWLEFRWAKPIDPQVEAASVVESMVRENLIMAAEAGEAGDGESLIPKYPPGFEVFPNQHLRGETVLATNVVKNGDVAGPSDFNVINAISKPLTLPLIACGERSNGKEVLSDPVSPTFIDNNVAIITSSGSDINLGSWSLIHYLVLS
ncbi:hypothetical protein LIER_40143 [Lithospermum erythrorhizon]|uniref:CCHC-type domain-containing protein n=1 Tax=Lithospermum erythrorhizon TaxID=34254 RepID=A0AAV3QRC5_LITER